MPSLQIINTKNPSRIDNTADGIRNPRASYLSKWGRYGDFDEAENQKFMFYFCRMEMFFTLDEIEKAAERFWQAVGNRRVFAFHGPLGAGKTTFIAALCRAKGVKDEPSSPTFSLINDYLQIDKRGEKQHFYHMDMYRINDEEEAIRAGIEDCLYSGAICFVEWPEKIPDLLPEDTLHLFLSLEGDGRKLRMA